MLLPVRLWLLLAVAATAFILSSVHKISSSRYNVLSFDEAPATLCPTTLDREVLPIDHTRQRCSPLVSANPSFALRLCHDNERCNEFSLRISRADAPTFCHPNNIPRQLSPNAGVNERILAELGPDTFELVTDGAERWGSASPVYEGGCSWRFDVQLRAAGPVWLRAWHTYTNYTAFDDVDRSFPELLASPLFASPVALSICPQCSQELVPRQLPSTSSQTYPPSDDKRTDARQGLPECSRTDPVPGSYLPVHPLDSLQPPAQPPLNNKGVASAGHYTFVPHACRWTHAGQRFGDPAKCVEKKRTIFVVGDSHGRVVADGLQHRLLGRQNVMEKSEKQGHKIHHVGNLTIDFVWDPKGANTNPNDCIFGGRELDSVDVFVLSMSAHHMADDPTDYFLKYLRTYISNVATCAAKLPSERRPTFVYLTGPAVIPRLDHYPRDSNDQRTASRAKVWRDLTMKMTREAGWRFVDQYDLTRSFDWDVLDLDMAHFLATDALDPVLDDVIGKTGICD